MAAPAVNAVNTNLTFDGETVQPSGSEDKVALAAHAFREAILNDNLSYLTARMRRQAIKPTPPQDRKEAAGPESDHRHRPRTNQDP